MDIRLEHTDGLGRQAQVWLAGRLLTVCDNVSAPGRRCPPGPLEGVGFTYMTEEPLVWTRAVGGNRSKRRTLEPLRGWAYEGFGRVISILPVTIDFGLLTMPDANWTTDEDLVGAYIKIAIDRLELVHAVSADWPEHVR